ncbi:MAG: serine protease [Gammaproteobacteria bacterium]|nr:serine protease [Gammaproteobacteria bacterium]
MLPAAGPDRPAVSGATAAAVQDTLLFSVVPVATFAGDRALTHATGFLYAVDERLFLVTCRHVLCDTDTDHHPDRIEIELHTDALNLAAAVRFSLPLYREGRGLWCDARDDAGSVDVAAIELERARLPAAAHIKPFNAAHLPTESDFPGVGSSALIPGFPLGFRDHLHHLPVVRQAVVASVYGLRFDGNGYFLTDARTHRGTSGAPVVMRMPPDAQRFGDLPWLLLGIHAMRLDLCSRDQRQDEALGLNCAWYSSVLPILVSPR